MSQDTSQPVHDHTSPNGQRAPLAIVGIGCRFPKADSLEEYWSNIRRGVDAISDVPTDSHWDPDDYFDDDKNKPDMTYARRGGFLNPIDFDPLEFGVAPTNIEATDTTQLLGMLAARDALRDAGYATARDATDGRPFDRDRCSCIMGVTGTLELVIPLGARLGHPIWRRALKEAGVDDATTEDVVQRIADGYVPWQENSFPGLLGNVAAGRIANRFDLGGSNCVVDAACASSLSAVHMAAMELWAGRADMAITGGLDTFNDIFMYMCFSKTPALSPTGSAKPFSADGDGTILGEGLGVLILKRLDDAQRDGDKVYAVIRGIGSSSDGRGNAIYAPSSKGQTKALRNAYRDANVSPDTIELIEAHGTGTIVGDATEVRALKEVYGEGTEAGEEGTEARRHGGTEGSEEERTSNVPWAAIGSVKSMVGHTKAAAGVAGLIKAAMAVNRGVLPPTIKVDEPLDEFADAPVYVNTEARPWLTHADHPRRAAVSAFGFGGSNFHCVVEQPPAPTGAPAARDENAIDFDGRVVVLPLSADSREALIELLDAFETDTTWQELRVESAVRRAAFDGQRPCRLALVLERDRHDLSQTIAKAKQLLASQPNADSFATPDGIYFDGGPTDRKLAVLFPGQGSQRVGMLRDLACTCADVRQALEQANTAFARASAESNGHTCRLSDHVYPIPSFSDDARAANESALRDTRVAQPALGAVEAGAWRVLQRFGIHADAFAGHSYGELVALWAAGRIEDSALHDLSNARGRLMAEVAAQHGEQAGAMLAVFAPRDRVETLVAIESPNVVLANHNAPEQVVLSGSVDDTDSLAKAFESRNIRCKRLPVAAAFHSSFVADAETPFADALVGVAFEPGDTPVYANSTGDPYPADASDARRLLAGQLANPVRFVRQIQAMHAEGVRTFVEVGPGRVLTGLVGSILTECDHAAIALDTESSASGTSGGNSGGDVSGGSLYNLACAVARLAVLGHGVDLKRFDAQTDRASIGSEKPSKPRKPRMTVRLTGANYVAPRPPRQPRQPQTTKRNGDVDRAARSPATPTAGRPEVAQPPQPPTTQPKPPHTQPSPATRPAALTNPTNNPNAPQTPAPATPSPAVSPHATNDLLQATQQNILALQRMQEQTAALHKQYLEGQHAAHQTVRQLIEQQQALLTGSPMPPPSVRPAPTPTQPTPTPTVPVQPAAPQTPRSPAIPAAVQAAQPASAPPPPQAPAPAPSAPSPATNNGSQQTLLEVVADKTGYPVEMLDLDMSLDADLGIDSIKRVEILSAFQDRVPDAPPVKPEDLGVLETLRQIVDYLGEAASAAVPESPAAPPAPAPATASPTPSSNGSQQTLLEVVADKTGYPVEMLDLDMSLDADLGIDSIKRVEILSAFQDRVPDAPPVKPEDLGVLETLRQIVDYLGQAASAAVPATSPEARAEVAPARPFDPAPADPPSLLDLSVLNALDVYDVVPGNASATSSPLNLTHAPVWVAHAGEDDVLATALISTLQSLGLVAHRVALDALPDAPSASALIVTTDDSMTDADVASAFACVRHFGRPLCDASTSQDALLAAVTCLGGSAGLDTTGGLHPPSAALAGIVKSARFEWPNVQCRVVDAPTTPSDAADAMAQRILRALLTDGPPEILLADDPADDATVVTPTLMGVDLGAVSIDQPPIQPGELLVVTGGARGVTARCAVAMAQAWRPHLLLLGRSAAPTPEPDWLAPLTYAADIKRAIIAQQNGKPDPRAVEAEYRQRLANREVLETLRQIEQAGATVTYTSVDVRDTDAMAAAVDAARQAHGPVRGLVHGAGVLADRFILDQTDEQFNLVYSTKVQGLRALLAAAGDDDVRVMAMFSSSTARFGRKGQVAYAAANEVVNKIAQVEARRRPACRVVSFNFGPWDGGMVTPALKQVFADEGINVIPLDAGVTLLVAALSEPLGDTPHAVERVVLGAGSRLDDAGVASTSDDGESSVTSPEGGAAPTVKPHVPNDNLHLVFEREVSLDAQPVLRSHVLNGKAVLPVALMVEWLAHGAMHNNPGLAFVGLNDLRVFKGLIFDAAHGTPLTARVLAGPASAYDDGEAVPVELRTGDTLHARARIVLSHALPTAQPADQPAATELFNESPAAVYADQRLFHGPDFQVLTSIDACDASGIVGQASAGPAPAKWVDRPMRANWLADPAALDAAFQLMIVWSQQQRESASLPTGLGRYRQFARAFPADGTRITARVTRAGDHEATADIEWLDATGNLVARLEDYTCVIDASLNEAFVHSQLLEHVEASGDARLRDT